LKTPVIIWSEVILPGIPGELTLDEETGRALAQWHEYLGFGTAEVLLIPAEGATRATLAEIAPLDGPTMDLAASELAALSEWEGPDPGRKGWTGPMAKATPVRPQQGAVDGDRLRRDLITHLLAVAEDPQEVVDAVIELGVRKAPDWKVVFWAAHAVFDDPDMRRAVLTEPLEDTVARLAPLLTRSEDIQSDFEALLGGVADGPMLAVIDGLGACERLASMGVGVKLSEQDRKGLHNVRKQLEDAHARIDKMME
jgi:hypothetical protein